LKKEHNKYYMMEKNILIGIFKKLGFRQVRDTDVYIKESAYITFTCLFDDDGVNINIRIFMFDGQTFKNYDYFEDIYFVKTALKDGKNGIPKSIGDNNLHKQIDDAINLMFS